MSAYSPIHDPEALLTTEQVAQMRACSVSTIRRERRERRGISFVRTTNNTVRYRRKDVVAFNKAHLVEVKS